MAPRVHWTAGDRSAPQLVVGARTWTLPRIAGALALFADIPTLITIAKGGTGATTAAGARTSLGVITAAKNASIASQSAGGFSADTYVTDSDVQIPTAGVAARTRIIWTIVASKTAAGSATPIYSVRIGATRTTGDTARLVLTGPAQTAAADTAVITITLTVRSVSANGVIQGVVQVDHNLAATGFANNAGAIVAGTSATFDDSALGGQYIGLSINAGASAVWTVSQVIADAAW